MFQRILSAVFSLLYFSSLKYCVTLSACPLLAAVAAGFQYVHTHLICSMKYIWVSCQ